MRLVRSGVLTIVSLLALQPGLRGAACVLKALEPASPSTAQSNVTPFTVGYLRTIEKIGMLEVVARFTGEKWVNTWEGRGDTSDPVLPLDRIPLSWLGKPVPRVWTAWSADGRTRVVHIAGTARGPACEAPTMLTLAPTDVLPSDTGDVAIDSDQPVLGFRERGSSEPEADRAAMDAVALDAFRAATPAAIADFRGDGLLPKSSLTPTALAGQPIRVAFLSRPRSSSPAIAYFEVFQQVKGDAGYGIRAAGWMRLVAGRWLALDVTADVKTSDGRPIPSRQPLGIFQLAGHDYVLVRLNGYEGWATGIYEVEGDTMREILVTPGGGC